MKTIKSTVLTLLVLLMGTCLITSCSKEDEVNTQVKENAKVAEYLKSFYSTNYQLGKSTITKVRTGSSLFAKTAEFDDITITEVLIENETRARGYVITSKESNVFLYFVDVDRIEYKMTTVDIEANQTNILENIEAIDKYISTNEFDFIKVTQDLINENGQAGTLSRIRYSYGSCFNGVRGVYQATFFLGIQWTNWSGVLNENGIGHVTVGCTEKYIKDLSAD